jgi:hypothetical protein
MPLGRDFAPASARARPRDRPEIPPPGQAAHESPRKTKLYARTGGEITLDEIERITI